MFLLLFSSCSDSRIEKFYSDRNNFVNASGVVDVIEYSEKTNAIFLYINDLTPKFSDKLFCIAAESGKLLRSKGIENYLHEGDYIEFVSSIAYFGDGYVMPIVSLTIDGKEFLSFEEGYNNFMNTF